MPNEHTAISQSTDERLVARIAGGDVNAFDALYFRYVHIVAGMARVMLGRAEADEATQEVFMRLWDRASTFDPSRGEFRPWFTAIARNYIIGVLRSKGIERQIAVVGDIERVLAREPDPAVDIETATIAREQGDEMLTALRTIPEAQRRVLVMAYFGGLSQSQIAQELNLPLGTVKKRTRLGLRKLRRLIDEQSISDDLRHDESRAVRP